MQDRTGSGPATQPETAHPQDSNANPESQNLDGNGESARPVLSLVSESPGHASHVEDGFFAKGAADDKAAMEMYAAMLPRGFSLRQINPRYLIIAGATVLLLVGVAAGRHLPGGSHAPLAASPDETSPSVAPAPAAAAPVVPSPAPAVAVPVVPTAQAPAVAAAPPAPPAPTAEAAPAVAVAPAAAAAPTAEAAPVAVMPTPAAATQPVAKEMAAPTPTAAAPAEQPAAQPEKLAAPAPALAAPAPEPKAAEPAPKPAETAPAVPVAGAVASESQNVQACRDAIKKRDMKTINASCDAAIAADNSLAKPLLSFAKAQFEKGKSAQAAVWARKIVQVNNSLADAYLIMGAAEQEAHHAAAAKTAYQRYLELAPKGPYADDVRSSLKSL